MLLLSTSPGSMADEGIRESSCLSPGSREEEGEKYFIRSPSYFCLPDRPEGKGEERCLLLLTRIMTGAGKRGE